MTGDYTKKRVDRSNPALTEAIQHWPPELSKLLSKRSIEQQVNDLTHREKSVLTTQDYQNLLREKAMHNDTVQTLISRFHKWLPPARRRLYGVAQLHACSFDAATRAYTVIRCFPKEPLSLEELLNFTLLFLNFLAPHDVDGCGHFNISYLPSILDALLRDAKPTHWPMDHLDSLGAGQDVQGRVDLLNEVMHMILQNDGIPAVATRRTVHPGRYKNAFCFFSLRAGKAFLEHLWPSQCQVGLSCGWISLPRAIALLIGKKLGVDAFDDVEWPQRHGRQAS